MTEHEMNIHVLNSIMNLPPGQDRRRFNQILDEAKANNKEFTITLIILPKNDKFYVQQTDKLRDIKASFSTPDPEDWEILSKSRFTERRE